MFWKLKSTAKQETSLKLIKLVVRFHGCKDLSPYLEITTGLHRGELCGLMWSDFDEQKGTLSIRRTLHAKTGGGYYVGDTKTGTGHRIIKIAPTAEAAADGWQYGNAAVRDPGCCAPGEDGAVLAIGTADRLGCVSVRCNMERQAEPC